MTEIYILMETVDLGGHPVAVYVRKTDCESNAKFRNDQFRTRLKKNLVEPLIEYLLRSMCGDLAFGMVARQCVKAGYSKEEVLSVLKPMFDLRFIKK